MIQKMDRKALTARLYYDLDGIEGKGKNPETEDTKDEIEQLDVDS